MNNDLISRSALKKAYFNAINETSIGEVSIIDLIDNAPAVEQKYYERVIAQINPVIEARPQGEWIYDNKINNWRCSECGETPKTIGYVGNREFMNEHFKFCNHCGAKMKGGAEND